MLAPAFFSASFLLIFSRTQASTQTLRQNRSTCESQMMNIKMEYTLPGQRCGWCPESQKETPNWTVPMWLVQDVICISPGNKGHGCIIHSYVLS